MNVGQARTITGSTNLGDLELKYFKILSRFLHRWVDHVVLVPTMCISLNIIEFEESYGKAGKRPRFGVCLPMVLYMEK